MNTYIDRIYRNPIAPYNIGKENILWLDTYSFPYTLKVHYHGKWTPITAIGKSVYLIAVENGFLGTPQLFIASLKGEPGDSSELEGIVLDIKDQIAEMLADPDTDAALVALVAVALLTANSAAASANSATTAASQVGQQVEELALKMGMVLGEYSSVTYNATAGTAVQLDSLKCVIDAPANTEIKVLLTSDGVITNKTYSLFVYKNDGTRENISTYNTDGYTGFAPNREQKYKVTYKFAYIAIYISASDVISSGELKLEASIVDSLKKSVDDISEQLSNTTSLANSLHEETDNLALALDSIVRSFNIKKDYSYTIQQGGLYSLKKSVKYHFKIETTSDGTYALYLRVVDNSTKEVLLQPTTIPVNETTREFDFTPTKDVDVFIGYGNGIEPRRAVKETVSSSEGVTSKLTSVEQDVTELKAKVNAINNSNDLLFERKYIDDNVPYYVSAPSDLTSYSNDSALDASLSRVPTSGKKFIFFTDTHEQGIDIVSKKVHIVPLINYVKKKLGITKVVFGGDLIDAYYGSGSSSGYEGGQYQSAAGLRKYASEYYDAFGTDLVWVEGNHDANIPEENRTNKDAAYIMPAIQSYLRTTANCSDVYVFNDAAEFVETNSLFSGKDLEEFKYWCKKTYYCDDDINKIRFIVVETGNFSYTVRECGVPASIWYQIDFIYNAMKSAKSGYSIAILGHQLGSGSISTYHPYYHPNSLLANLVYAYKHKSSCTLTPWNKGGNVTAYWTSKHGSATASAEYNFEDITPDNIFMMGGHYHIDEAFLAMPSGSITEKLEPPTSGVSNADKIADFVEYGSHTSIQATNAALIVWTNRGTFKQESSTERTSISELPKAKVWTMNEGTTSDYSFDVVTISGGKLYCTRFGAGEDRVFDL